MANIFSVAAFFIVLREVLEACLVVGIVLAYLNKTGATHLRRWVWIGAVAGIVLSLALGVTFAVIFYTRGDKLFSGKNEKIFEGIVFLIAAALLTSMVIWMQKMGQSMQNNFEKKVEKFVEAEGNSGKWGVFLIVFVQVLREGIETWIFLFGAANAEDGKDAWRAIPLPGILAVIVGLGASYAMFRGLVELDITQFFWYSSVILMAFSAGLTSHAFHELQEADWFGEWAKDKTQRDWWNARLWSTKACCDDKKNQFFAFLRALFGYQDTPTFIEWGTYFAYWILILAVLVWFNWASVRAARSRVASLAKLFTATALICTFIAFIYVISNATWNGVLTMTIAFLLSIVAAIAVFDALAERVQALSQSRKTLSLVSGAGFAVLTLFIMILHIVQMACDEEGVAKCSMPRFYYDGLIFSEKWASQGRAEDGNSWVSLAVLSWSCAVIVFFLGALAFLLVVFSGNLNSDGTYIYDTDSKKNDEIQNMESGRSPVLHED